MNDDLLFDIEQKLEQEVVEEYSIQSLNDIYENLEDIKEEIEYFNEPDSELFFIPEEEVEAFNKIKKDKMQKRMEEDLQELVLSNASKETIEARKQMYEEDNFFLGITDSLKEIRGHLVDMAEIEYKRIAYIEKNKMFFNKLLLHKFLETRQKGYM